MSSRETTVSMGAYLKIWMKRQMFEENVHTTYSDCANISNSVINLTVASCLWYDDK